MKSRSRTRSFHSLEPLEPRIAPASTLAFVDANTATYNDVDGDHVTVHFSKPILTQANLTTLLVTMPKGAGDLLQEIHLMGLSAATGTDIMVSVKAAPGGDGFTEVQRINATGIDLGTIKIQGDLGTVTAGSNGASNVAIRDLELQTFGLYSAAHSFVSGQVGAIKIKGDDVATMSVIDTTSASNASVGSIFIGGTLRDDASINMTGTLGSLQVDRIFSGGNISATGNIGAVKVAHGISDYSSSASTAIESTDGGILSLTIGGTSLGSAPVMAKTNIGPVKLSGDFQGQIQSTAGSIASVKMAGAFAGSIEAAADLGPVSITGDLKGTVKSDNGNIASLKVTGSVLNGQITANSAGSMKIGGDVVFDGAGTDPVILVFQSLKSLSVGGSVLGVPPVTTISADQLGPVTIGRDVTGAKIGDNGATGIASVQIKGSMLNSVIEATGAMGAISIGGDMDNQSFILENGNAIASVHIGGSMAASLIEAKTNIGKITIGHDLTAQSGIETNTGSIDSINIAGSMTRQARIDAQTDLHTFTVGHNMSDSVVVVHLGSTDSAKVGGTVSDASRIDIHQTLNSVSVGGNLVGSDIVSETGDIGTLSIRGSLRNNAGIQVSQNLNSAAIGGDVDSSFIMVQGGDLLSLKVGGSLIGDVLDNSIVVQKDIDFLSIRGDADGAGIVSLTGKLGTLKIGGSVELENIHCVGNIDSVSIGGSVILSKIFAVGATGVPLHVGTITIGGDLIESNIIAGVTDKNSDGFGNADDQLLSSASTIDSIVIGGIVSASTSTSNFGLEAHEITSVKIHGASLSLHAGPANDVISLSPVAGSVTLREV